MLLLLLQRAKDAVAAQTAEVEGYKEKLQAALMAQEKLQQELKQAQHDIVAKVI